MTPAPTAPANATRRRLQVAGIAVAVVLAAAGLAAAVRPLLRPAPSSDTALLAPTEQSSALPPAPPPPVKPAGKKRQPEVSRPQGKPRKDGRTTAKPKSQPKPSPAAEVAVPPVDPRLRPFVGLSTWIDIYDTDLTPAQQIARAAAGGVELIFVQSARHKSPTDIQDAARLGQVLELAHDNGMLVMVWYVPDFVREARDLRRAQVAIAFVSPRGDRPDAFGLDIEIEDEPNVAARTERLLRLSAALRDWVGMDYPMAAIVLPPLQLDLRPSWWPDFPYAQLRPYYDIYIPMSYSSYRGTDAQTTYNWNVENVAEMRARTGDSALPVHLAGGIADNFPEVGVFVRAVRDAGAIGGGLYDLHTTHPDAWAILHAMRAQPAR